MNINKLLTGLDPRNRTDNLGNKSASPSLSQAQSSTEDQVKLSDSSKSIQQAEAKIRSMSEIDDATVERIRAAIENGEYKIDYEKLAGKMLAFEGKLNP